MNFLTQELLDNGWTELHKDWEYRKGSWKMLRDTGSWWQLGTESVPVIFDIHEPGKYEVHWTVNLIEHLCNMEDERMRLRNSLLLIAEASNENPVLEIARNSLHECYHRWLLRGDEEYCPVCGAIKAK